MRKQSGSQVTPRREDPRKLAAARNERFSCAELFPFAGESFIRPYVAGCIFEPSPAGKVAAKPTDEENGDKSHKKTEAYRTLLSSSTTYGGPPSPLGKA